MADVRDRRFFDRDALTGVTEWFHYDDETGGFQIETTQDLEPFVEVVTAVSNDAATHWRGDLHHVASIPQVMIMQLAQQKILSAGGRILDEKRFRRWLNDRDNRAFRTKPGKV